MRRSDAFCDHCCLCVTLKRFRKFSRRRFLRKLQLLIHRNTPAMPVDRLIANQSLLHSLSNSDYKLYRSIILSCPNQIIVLVLNCFHNINYHFVPLTGEEFAELKPHAKAIKLISNVGAGGPNVTSQTLQSKRTQLARKSVYPASKLVLTGLLSRLSSDQLR